MTIENPINISLGLAIFLIETVLFKNNKKNISI